MDWDKLRVFHAVSIAGSFTKATDTLNISQSAISRQISILEEELGTPLFERVPRGLVLTDAGVKLHDTVLTVFAKLSMTQATMTELKNYPRGHIKLATSVAFGSLWLAPQLKEFLDLYPEIKISLNLTDEDVDLNMREADVGIIVTPIKSPDLIHEDPVTFPFCIYASRAYLDKFGTPQTVNDLDHHRLIAYGKEIPHLLNDLDWILKVGAQKPRIPFLVISNGQAVYEAVRSGLGIAALQKYIVKDDPDLVEILKGQTNVSLKRYITYPIHHAELKRVKVFVDFLKKKMKEELNSEK